MSRRKDEIAEFIEAIRPVKVGVNNYTRTDRYRDFHAVFSTDQGKRVLAQIVDYCDGKTTREDEASDHAKLVWRAAQRDVGLRISSWASVPPREEPKGEQ